MHGRYLFTERCRKAGYRESLKEFKERRGGCVKG
jgi:hypothetical protein